MMKITTRQIKFTASVALAIAVLGGLHHTASAQAPPQTPNAGDAVQQATPPVVPGSETKAGEMTEPEFVIEEPENPVSLPESEKLFVKSINLDGASDNEQEKLQPLLEPYLNRELTMAEMNEAARTITRYYRDHGFLVARAYVPKQSSVGGALTIGIVRGSYGAISVKNNSRLRQRVVQGVFNQMKTNSPSVTQNSLERAMTLLKEMPGGTMPNVAIKPGKVPGTTDLTVTVDEVRRYHGYLEGDNQGSQFTGRKRAYAGFEVYSPLGLGDLFSLTAMVTQAEGLKNGGASYAIPLNYNGLRLEASYSQTTYTLGGAFATLDGTGAAKTYEGTLSYPVRRRHDESIDFLVSGARKALHDNLAAVDTINPRIAYLGTATLQRSKFGTIFKHNVYSAITGIVEAGQLEVLDSTQRGLSDSDGTYGKLNFKYSAALQIERNLTAKTSLSAQKDISNKVLDSSEQLFINGSGGVRAYAESASGDNGYVFTEELRYALPKIKFLPKQQALTGFFDNGALCAQKKGTSSTNFVLTDAGAGYSANFHSFFLNVQAANSIGAIKQHDELDHTHVWAQVGYVF